MSASDGHVEEEAVFDYADDVAEFCCGFCGVGDCAAGAVEDEVVLVGDVDGAVWVVAQLWVEAEGFELSGDDRQRHLDDFDREWEAAEDRYELGGVGNDDEAAGGAFDDLLAKECSAAAFDEARPRPLECATSSAPSMARSSSGHSSKVVIGMESDSASCWLASEVAMPRMRRPCFTRSPSSPNEDGRSGAGAEAERHSILDKLQGALGCHQLCFVLRHSVSVV